MSPGWLRFLAARLAGAIGLGPGVVRHDDDPSYRGLLSAAMCAYPDDPARQLACVRAHGTPQYELLALCEMLPMISPPAWKCSRSSRPGPTLPA